MPVDRVLRRVRPVPAGHRHRPGTGGLAGPEHGDQGRGGVLAHPLALRVGDVRHDQTRRHVLQRRQGSVLVHDDPQAAGRTQAPAGLEGADQPAQHLHPAEEAHRGHRRAGELGSHDRWHAVGDRQVERAPGACRVEGAGERVGEAGARRDEGRAGGELGVGGPVDGHGRGVTVGTRVPLHVHPGHRREVGDQGRADGGGPPGHVDGRGGEVLNQGRRRGAQARGPAVDDEHGGPVRTGGRAGDQGVGVVAPGGHPEGGDGGVGEHPAHQGGRRGVAVDAGHAGDDRRVGAGVAAHGRAERARASDDDDLGRGEPGQLGAHHRGDGPGGAQQHGATLRRGSRPGGERVREDRAGDEVDDRGVGAGGEGRPGHGHRGGVPVGTRDAADRRGRHRRQGRRRGCRGEGRRYGRRRERGGSGRADQRTEQQAARDAACSVRARGCGH